MGIDWNSYTVVSYTEVIHQYAEVYDIHIPVIKFELTLQKTMAEAAKEIA